MKLEARMKELDLPERILGKRIALKKHEISLAQEMFEFIDKDRNRLGQFLPWVPLIKSAEDEAKYIRTTHEHWEAKKLFDYGIFLLSNERTPEQYMGNLGVHSISWKNEHCELGYWIFEKFEGKGYVTEATRLIENLLFEMGFHRIEIRCSSINERSAGVPKRCGYHLDGILREDAIENGEFRNTSIYSKLKREWKAEQDRAP